MITHLILETDAKKHWNTVITIQLSSNETLNNFKQRDSKKYN